MPELVREPQFEGLFYPEEPGELGEQIDSLVFSAESAPRPNAKGYLLPHGSYENCGRCLGAAYGTLAASLSGMKDVSRAVFVAPALHAGESGIFLSDSTVFRNPIGSHPVDSRFSESLLASSTAIRIDESLHLLEHTIEVHLPFLSTVMGPVPIVPILLGPGIGEAGTRSLGSALLAADLEAEGRSLYFGIANTSRLGTPETSKATASAVKASVLSRDARSILDVANGPPGLAAWSAVLWALRSATAAFELAQGSSLPENPETPELVQYTAFCIE